MDNLANQICARLDDMKAGRQEHETHWRECYKYTFPFRGTGFAGTTSPEQMRKEQADLLDSTGSESANVLAASIVSGLTPANDQWLNLKSDSDKDAVERWLSIVAAKIWRNIHASGFDAECFEGVVDGVVGGMFALYIDINRTRGGFMFQQWPLSQCYFASSTNMTIDTVFRAYKLTAAQAVAAFGDKCGEAVNMAAKDKPETKFDFIHAIFPRAVYKPQGLRSRNMPFASVHVCKETRRVARESGFHEFPVVAPRYNRIPGTVYGTGAVSLALPDIKELNVLKGWEKKAAALAVAGMFIAEDDGVLNPSTVKVGPGKIIVANSVESMRPLMTGSDFKVAFTSEANLQAQIRKVMMADTLGQQGGQPMTATEVQARLNLLRQQLGPVFGRFQAEYLTPLVERCFYLMLRDGALPEPPAEMDGVNFHVTFDNPLARAQRMTQVAAIEQLEQGLVGLSQALGPEVMDIFNLEAAQREKAFALGVPMACIRSEEEVAAVRQQRAQQQQAAQQQDQSNQMALQNNQAAANAQGAIATQQAAGAAAA